MTNIPSLLRVLPLCLRCRCCCFCPFSTPPRRVQYSRQSSRQSVSWSAPVSRWQSSRSAPNHPEKPRPTTVLSLSTWDDGCHIRLELIYYLHRVFVVTGRLRGLFPNIHRYETASVWLAAFDPVDGAIDWWTSGWILELSYCDYALVHED